MAISLNVAATACCEPAENYVNSGARKRGKGDLDGAIADYSKAIQLKPDYATAYYDRGAARMAKGDLDASIADYGKAIELQPDMVTAYNGRGIARHHKGDLEGSMSDYNRAIELDPKYVMAYYNRGAVKKAKGDLEGSIMDYSLAIALKPDLAVAYNNRGLSRKAKGDLDGAIADYTKAIALDPDLAVAHSNYDAAKKAKADGESVNAVHATDIEFKSGASEVTVRAQASSPVPSTIAAVAVDNTVSATPDQLNAIKNLFNAADPSRSLYTNAPGEGAPSALVRNFLRAVARHDFLRTKAYLSQNMNDDAVVEFIFTHAKSALSYSEQVTKIERAVIDDRGAKAIVKAHVEFMDGNPPAMTSRVTIFKLVLEDGAWRISGFVW
jgi:tetratricopeptide (TPR) repeat protein